MNWVDVALPFIRAEQFGWVARVERFARPQ